MAGFFPTVPWLVSAGKAEAYECVTQQQKVQVTGLIETEKQKGSAAHTVPMSCHTPNNIREAAKGPGPRERLWKCKKSNLIKYQRSQ